jgi:putative aminopeptidase FrvX
MAIDLPLLKELCEAPGAPGREEAIREIVIRELEPICDEIRIDALGNVIALKRGSMGGRFMAAGHMDEIGFMISHVDDNGYLRFIPLGGFDPKTLVAQRVVVHGREDLLGVMGSKPVHIMSAEEKTKMPKIEDFFIDLGLPAETVKDKVRIGDVVTRDRDIVKIGEMINGKSFDDRVGVFVMIEAMKAMKANKMDIYAVASVQEEVGVRGATVAAAQIDPHVGIALDVTLANDLPGAQKHQYITEMGAGCAIKVYDSSVIPNWKLVDFMRSTCEDREIPHQLEVLPRGGTDTSAIQRGANGAAAGAISVPTRYVHSVIEMVHPDDIQHSIDLLAAMFEECEQDQFAL